VGITYIRLASGFVYLMAVIDRYSRYVLGWALSTTLDADFCIEAVGNITERQQCEILNTDQGSQSTTPRFTRPLLDKGIKVSMDGRGRALDNIFVERLSATAPALPYLLHPCSRGGRSSMSMCTCRIGTPSRKRG
jgi:putative transposase